MFDDVVKDILHWHFERIEDREVVFIMKTIVLHELSKDMVLFEYWAPTNSNHLHIPHELLYLLLSNLYKDLVFLNSVIT